MSVMMAPGTLGIITDAVGLLLIAIAPIPAMERFAVFCGFWAFMLVPTNVFLTPLLLSYLPEPKNVDRIIGLDAEHARSHVLIKQFLHKIARLTYGKRSLVTRVIVLVSFIVCLALSLQNKNWQPSRGQ